MNMHVPGATATTSDVVGVMSGMHDTTLKGVT